MNIADKRRTKTRGCPNEEIPPIAFDSRQLRTQLILYIMVISLAVLAGASYFIYSFMQNMIKIQNERLLYQQFQQLDHNIGGLVKEIDRLSMLFAR